MWRESSVQVSDRTGCEMRTRVKCSCFSLECVPANVELREKPDANVTIRWKCAGKSIVVNSVC